MSRIYELKIGRDSDIRSAISDFILTNGWDDVYITGAVGSVRDTAYNAPADNSIPMKLVTRECPGAAEVLSFCGEVMSRERMDEDLKRVYRDEGPLFVHIHASCVTGSGQIFGGGLIRGRAFRALRVFMMPLEQEQVTQNA